ncbi:MAG: hypothetical protein ACE5E0_01530 [Terriglobia bacterium]
MDETKSRLRLGAPEFATGEKAGAGDYECENCRAIMKQADERELPACPSCKIWTLYHPRTQGAK